MEEIIINSSEAEEKKRPQPLTILCVLSFIGIGWSLINSIISFSKNPEEEMEKLQQSMEQSDSYRMGDATMMTKIMEGTITMLEHQQALSVLNLLYSIIALTGVLLMWKLNKKGFWLYIAAQIISIVGVFGIIGVSFMSLMVIGIGGVFSILFIVLYALQVKQMN